MPAIPIIAAATAVVGTGYSIYQGQQMQKQTKEASNLQRQQNDLASARQKRDSIRAARAAAASTTQNAENQGASNSSAAFGGQASIQSQLSDNLSFLDINRQINDQASIALSKAQDAQYKADAGASVAKLGVNAFAHSNDIQSQIKKIFHG